MKGPGYSELDEFVMTNIPKQAAKYRSLCGRLFLAQRLAFGFVELIDLVDLLVRAGLIWWTVRTLAGTETITARTLFLIAGLHTWAFVKGKDL